MMKKAFSLAEVLITLSIIGVIAALTIPTLVQQTQDTQMRTAWKQTFAEFSQVGIRVRSEVGGNLSDIFGANINDDNIMRDYFAKYLNYTKKCDSTRSVTDGCWYNKAYTISGIYSAYNWNNFAGLVLNNGNLVSIDLWDAKCINPFAPNKDLCGMIITDINGFSGPNRIGKDVFLMYIIKNGTILPVGTQGDTWYNSSTHECNPTNPNAKGTDCSADYLYK